MVVKHGSLWARCISGLSVVAALTGCSSEPPYSPPAMPVASLSGRGAPAASGTAAAPPVTAPIAGVGSVTTPPPTPPRAGTASTMPTPATGGRGAPVSTAGTMAVAAGTGAAVAGTGAAAGTGMAAAGSGSTPLPMATGPGPTIPMAKGECPMFMNGTTIMIGGHKGVAITAGAPGKGGPLLFYWHGTGGNASEAQRTLPAGVRNEITAAGGIIASFNGNQSAGTGRDCSGTGAHNMADFDAADEIVACAVKTHGIDAHRIYSTGCSAGGLQTGCMAQMRSSYIAAAAPNSGGVVVSQAWQDKHSPAILTMHGGSSDMVIVTFSQTSATLDMNAKMHGSFVVNCNHGGGHCQAPAALQTAAWQFMKDHPWGFTMSPWASMFPAGVPDYCKVY